MAEPIRLGINGFGTMGRYLVRAIHKDVKAGRLKEGEIEFVAFNDAFPADHLAHLVANDSVYHDFDGEVSVDGSDLLINGKRVFGSTEREPSNIPWHKYGVEVVYESTGVFENNPKVRGHFEAGAKKVIISAPSNIADVTIVPGVTNNYHGEGLVSLASCTTNCLLPVEDALIKKYGEHIGVFNTVHAYTNDQRLVDSPHKDPARAYAAGQSIIPTTSGAAVAASKAMPELEGRLKGGAQRVPVPSGSSLDLAVVLNGSHTEDDINYAIREAAEGYLKGALEYRKGPIISFMILKHHVPSIFDASQTRAVQYNGFTLAKITLLYDNIAGFSHQAVKLIKLVRGE